MLFRRFQQITRCLQLNDNSKIPDKALQIFDTGYRVTRPLMKMLNANFKKEYKRSSHVAVNESTALFKGISAMKQYMPLKPKIKRGYKCGALLTEILVTCESLAGTKAAQSVDPLTWRL